MAERELQAYYARDEERDRLSVGVGRVEYLRTVEVVSRTIPPPPAVVADIGGGPGRYTDWLVDAGYTVIHRDLVARHVDEVSARHAQAVDARVGDARSLDLPDEAVDAVLLLGPLYHLEDGVDRAKALSEARRIVRSGGRVYVAAISRWAPRLDGVLVQRYHPKHSAILDMVDEAEATGEMRPVHHNSFNGYAHTPASLRGEVQRSGLLLESLVAVEGIAFALADLDERLADADERALLLDTLRAVEAVPDLMGLGPHLLATARQP
ncbi:MAG: class I SAM-dependent methyltransferase [Acidimicrobiia bacterium]|nr:class I SAM-dependent methyltransferase [Acidimicrobiia bacterium]